MTIQVRLIRIAGCILLFSALFLSSCTTDPTKKPRALGIEREKEILVICTNKVWREVEDTLRKKIEVPIHAVRWEPIFEIAQVEPQVVSYYKEWDKIILIESLENMQLLSQVVDKEILKKIGEGQGLFFTNVDIWSRGQRIAGLAAPKDDQLLPLVKFHGDRIFKDFLRQLEEREKERMFLSGRNSTLADSLTRCCGFSIMLPKVYERVLVDTLPDNQILYVHQDPVRSILISWQDDSEPLDLSPESLAVMRDSLLANVFPGMHTLAERVDTSTVAANNIPRLRIYGVWENRKEISGGIYISQIISDQAEHRRYYLDCLLFCPNARLNKYRYILQLDWIMNSFNFAHKV